MDSKSSNNGTALGPFSLRGLEMTIRAASWLFTAFLLVFSVGTAAPAAAQTVSGHLKIVFTSTRDYSCAPEPFCGLDEQYGELYTMNRNGSDQTRITLD